MTIQEIMGRKIREIRLERGISQTTLAEMVGYKDKTAVAKVEAGKVDLPQSKIIAFAEALHLSPSDLLGTELDRLALDFVQDSLNDLYRKLGYEYYTLTKIYDDLPKVAKELLLQQAKWYAHHFIGSDYQIADDNSLQRSICNMHIEADETEYASPTCVVPFTSVSDAKRYLQNREYDLAAFSCENEITDNAIISIANALLSAEQETDA